MTRWSEIISYAFISQMFRTKVPGVRTPCIVGAVLMFQFWAHSAPAVDMAYTYDANSNRLQTIEQSDGKSFYYFYAANGSITAIARGDLDADGDGLLTFEEILLGTNPFSSDSDGDGLDDRAEVEIHFTNPNEVDSDRDGTDDGAETALGRNPLINEPAAIAPIIMELLY